MTENTPQNSSEQNGQGGAVDPSTLPRLQILAQYVKDLSFENPHAPASLTAERVNPRINVSVDVQARPLESGHFETVLKLSVQADKENGEVVFIVELVYGGVFELTNVPENQVQPIILIECPRLIFPFARRVLADATRDGGFPPLMLDPIDFAALYQKQVEAQSSAAAQPAST